MAIEIEIADLPIDSMVDLSMVFWDCLPEGMYSYGHLSVISTYNPIYRMYNHV